MATYYTMTTPHGDLIAVLKDPNDVRAIAQESANSRGHKIWVSFDVAYGDHVESMREVFTPCECEVSL